MVYIAFIAGILIWTKVRKNQNERKIEINRKNNLFLRRIDLHCGVLFKCVPHGTRKLRERYGGSLFNYHLRGMYSLLFGSIYLAKYASDYLSGQFDNVSSLF